MSGFSAIGICVGPAPNCQLSSWAAEQESPGEGGLLAYLGGGGGPAWIACYKSTWPKVEADGAGRRIWEMSRQVVASEYEGDTGCYQEGSLKGDSSSQLTVFCLLGGRCLGHRYQQGQKGQHCARTSPSHHQKAAPGFRGCAGVWNPAGLELEGVLGISSSVILRL